MSAWNEAWRVEALKRLWLDGVASGAIAAQLGVGRGAVMSKVRRLNLPYRGGAGSCSTATAKAARRPKTTTKSPEQITAERAKALAQYTAAEARTNAEASHPSTEHVTILVRKEDGKLYANPALTNRSCRWPIGNPRTPEFRFCGQPKISGLSYCPAHLAVAYVPLTPAVIKWVLTDGGLEAAGQIPDKAPESRVKQPA